MGSYFYEFCLEDEQDSFLFLEQGGNILLEKPEFIPGLAYF